MKRFRLSERVSNILTYSFLHRRHSTKMTTLETLRFDNVALKNLPIDPEERNYVRTVRGACFSRVMPTPVENPKLVAYSSSAMALLDLPQSELDRDSFVEYFSGNKLLPGSETAAHCYCGHQFGHFSGQLGDGAAMYLGEVINDKNERWEIQLKGAGLTPYSRTADGRKVLRSSIREFLCSEAVHFLGIPTSRAGTCITSDTEVIRDIFYNGHPKAEKCTIILRIAPTFIRFGSFEIFRTLSPITGRVGPSVGRTEILHALLNYVIETFYPEIHGCSNDQVQKYAAFFKEVVLRTARLVALWQSVGFCHGVLNTDNMSIVGLTIDYGPFGFLDIYDPNHICNASDDGGRYSFIKQPEICLWNLKMLAETIQQALPLNVSMPLLELYDEEFQTTYLNKMRAKLGLLTIGNSDKTLIQELLDTMENTGADFTNTFLSLMHLDANGTSRIKTSLNIVKEKLLENCYPLEVLKKMCETNLTPAQIATFKAIANSAIDKDLDRADLSIQNFFKRSFTILTQIEKAESFSEMTENDKKESDCQLWNVWLQKYKIRIEEDLAFYEGNSADYNTERSNIMKSNNPRFILRNYIAQDAIEKAENGDYSQVRRLVSLLENPYDHSYIEDIFKYDVGSSKIEDPGPSTCSENASNDRNVFDKPPNWAFAIRVT